MTLDTYLFYFILVVNYLTNTRVPLLGCWALSCVGYSTMLVNLRIKTPKLATPISSFLHDVFLCLLALAMSDHMFLR